ncbi:MAG TPA: RNA polymerase sigma factor [Polyangiales bacterium]|nr:RNA polymerase sigma factor [Polyangiales bacterium]
MQLQAQATNLPFPMLVSREHASQLMSDHAAGDARAFSALYPMLRPKLARLCRSFVGPDEAEDVLQEVFLKLHRARGTFTPGGNAFAWAYAVARATCLDRLRARAREAEVPMEPAKLELRAAPRSGGELGGMLDQVSDCLRTTYVLVKVEGMECREAAALLGTTTSAVKQRVHRATALLRAQLCEEA